MTKKLFFGLAITLFVFWFAVFYGAYKIVDSNSYERGFSDGAADAQSHFVNKATANYLNCMGEPPECELEKKMHLIMEETSENYRAKIASMEKKTWY
jgi:hypothetical protein